MHCNVLKDAPWSLVTSVFRPCQLAPSNRSHCRHAKFMLFTSSYMASICMLFVLSVCSFECLSSCTSIKKVENGSRMEKKGSGLRLPHCNICNLHAGQWQKKDRRSNRWRDIPGKWQKAVCSLLSSIDHNQSPLSMTPPLKFLASFHNPTLSCYFLPKWEAQGNPVLLSVCSRVYIRGPQ